MRLTRLEMLQFVKEHELTHRSQLFMLMRLKGMVPPPPDAAWPRRRRSFDLSRIQVDITVSREPTMLTCPVCDAEIDIEEDEVDEGESVGCDECGADLKVLGKTPLELSPADEVEDDEDEFLTTRKTSKGSSRRGRRRRGDF